MNLTVPQQLTSTQLENLKNSITILNEDISAIEHIIVPMLNNASKENNAPVIGFCHDVLQSLRLIPIYTRNILNGLPSSQSGEAIIEDRIQVLLSGLSVTIDDSIIHENNEGNPENLPVIIHQFCTQEDYFSYGVEVEVTKIHILSIKLNQGGQEVLQAIEVR